MVAVALVALPKVISVREGRQVITGVSLAAVASSL